MKILGIAFIASLVVILLIGVGMGIDVGLSNVFYNPSFQDDTREIDTTLLQKRVLDWVNTNRVKNNVGGLNLDDNLNTLANLRSTDMSKEPLDKADIISHLDINPIAKSNNLECIMDDASIPIQEYTLLITHLKFNTIEEFVEFAMGFLDKFESENEKVFGKNMTKTGISVSKNNDFLVIVQNFC